MASWLITNYVRAVHKARYVLLVLWLGIIVGGFFAAKNFPSAVTQDLPPPGDSQAFKARDIYKKYFPRQAESTGFVVFSDAVERHIDLGLDDKYLAFDRALDYAVKFHTTDFTDKDVRMNPFFVDADPKVVYSSFRSVAAAKFPSEVALAYLARGNTSCFGTIAYEYPQTTSKAIEFSRNVSDHYIPTLLERYNLTGNVDVNIFSLPTFMDEISASTTKDIITMFGIVVPLSLIIFAVSLSSVRYILLPLVSLIASAVLTFAFMYAVAVSRNVNSLAPGIAAALCLAFVIDYTYFIVAKYRKAVLYQEEEALDDLEVVEQFLGTGGRAVFISSMAMLACSFGIIFFPVEMLTTVGISCIISSLSAMVVTLNLIPALILSFPDFWRNGAFPWCTPKVTNEAFPSLIDNAAAPQQMQTPGRRAQSAMVGNSTPQFVSQENSEIKRSQIKSYNASEYHGYAHSEVSRASGMYRKNSQRATGYQELPPEPTPTDPREPQIRYHYQIVQFITAWPQNLLFVILAIGVASIFLAYAFGGEYSNDITQFVPRNSPLLPPWKRMQTVFKASEVFTYNMVIDLGPNKTKDEPGILSDEFYQNCQEMVQTMANELPKTYAHDFDGLCYSGVLDQNVTLNQTETAVQMSANIGELMKHPLALYRFAVFSIFGQDPTKRHTYMSYRPPWNPTGSFGVEWYGKALDLFPKLEKKFGFKLYLTGYPADTIDSIDYATSILPTIAGIELPIIFVAVTIAFGSLVIPLKCLLTVGLTIGCSFGLAKMVFQHGTFNFLQAGGLHGSGSIAWIVPLATFLISAGIALNYDLIAIVTVLEFRWRGLDSHNAIVKGAAATGREISVSAFMMIVVFSGLLFSEIAAMNELGLFFVATALFQGLFFRLFLTPSLMSLLGQYNWFPMQLVSEKCSGICHFTPVVLPPQDEDFPISPTFEAFSRLSDTGDHHHANHTAATLSGYGTSSNHPTSTRSADDMLERGSPIDEDGGEDHQGRRSNAFRANDISP